MKNLVLCFASSPFFHVYPDAADIFARFPVSWMCVCVCVSSIHLDDVALFI